MKKIIVFVLMCTLILSACSSGGSKADMKSLCKDKEIVSQLSKKETVADFVLHGTYYKLPVKLQALFDNGWEFMDQIEENPYKFDSLTMKANTYTSMTLVKDLKLIEVKVVNESGQDVAASGELMVTELSMQNDGLNEANEFVVKKGVTLKSTMNDVDAAFASLKGYESDKYSVSVEKEYQNIVRVESASDNEDKVEIIRVSLLEDESMDQYKQADFSEADIDAGKSETLATKRMCTLGSKKYPTSKYKKLVKDLKAGKSDISLVIKGHVVSTASSRKGFDSTGILDKTVYLVQDDLGNYYALYAELYSDVILPELAQDDSIEIYTNYMTVIATEDKDFYPLITAAIVNVNGQEVANAAYHN